MKIRMAFMSAFLVATTSAGPAQESTGTRAEQAACRADSRRFCRSVDPDSGTHGILTCLKQNRSKLNRACRGVLESHGQ
jgi:hypothetical protein